MAPAVSEARSRPLIAALATIAFALAFAAMMFFA